jgi:hypothetical protein
MEPKKLGGGSAKGTPKGKRLLDEIVYSRICVFQHLLLGLSFPDREPE